MKTENPLRLPVSYAKKRQLFALPVHCNNILLLSDLHIPYHDVRALTTAIMYGKDQKINTIFINGDLLDFYQISRYVNVHRKRSIPQELDAARQILCVLNKAFPKAPIYYLKGNHCMRLEKYLASHAPELLDMIEFRLEYLLHAKERNMTVIPDTTLVKMGHLTVTHGHHIVKGIIAPVNSARGVFLRAKASTLISHVHKVSSHSETTINDKTITCYSTGCLCELNPDYNPFGNSFVHGFAHVQTNGKSYRVRNIQVIDGKIIT